MQSPLISKPNGGLRRERRNVYVQFHAFQFITLLIWLSADLAHKHVKGTMEQLLNIPASGFDIIHVRAAIKTT